MSYWRRPEADQKQMLSGLTAGGKQLLLVLTSNGVGGASLRSHFFHCQRRFIFSFFLSLFGRNCLREGRRGEEFFFVFRVRVPMEFEPSRSFF